MRHGGLKSVQALKTGWVLEDEKSFTVDDLDVRLYLPFEGTNGDTVTFDASDYKHAVTINSGQISSAQAKFGNTSYQTSRITVVNPAEDTLNIFKENEWTMSMWVYPTGFGVLNYFCSTSHSSPSGMSNYWRNSGPYNSVESGPTVQGKVTSLMTTGAWHHWAWVEVSGAAQAIYLDGEQIWAGSVFNPTTLGSPFYIASRDPGLNPFDFTWQGYFDDLVMMKGNVFNASPNGGMTDTITVPTTPMYDLFASTYTFNFTPDDDDDVAYMIVGNIVNGYDGVTTYYISFNDDTTNRRTQQLEASGTSISANSYQNSTGVPVGSSGNINGICSFEALVDMKTPGTLSVPGNETRCVNVISGNDIVGAVNQQVAISGSAFWQTPVISVKVKADRANGIGPGSYLALYRKPRST